MAANIQCNEMLYDNILDKDIQAMFLPFNLIQLIFLLPKYRIYKNFLTFNSKKLDIFSSLGFILPCSCFLWRHIMVIPVVLNSVFITFVVSFDLLFHSSGFVMSYILNILHRKFNVELVLNIQRIFRMLKYTQYKHFKLFNLTSWFVLSLILLYYLLFLIFNLFCTNRGIIEAVSMFSLLYFPVMVIYLSRIINIINIQLHLWISELQSLADLLKSPSRCNERFFALTIQTIVKRSNKSKEYETLQEWKRLFEIYRKILETYDIYKTISQVYILYHCIETFTYTIIYTELFIKMESKNDDADLINWEVERILLGLLVMKDILINFYTSFSCQAFYVTVDKARHACIEVMAETTSLGAKRVCKNILRLHEVTFGKMEACRLFAIDAKLPFGLLSSIAYYVIVLIQFAALKK